MKELTLQTQIPISVEITGVNYESVEVSPRNLQVKLEDEETKKFPIVPKTTGTVRDGYALGEIQAVPEMVSIRGPKSVIAPTPMNIRIGKRPDAIPMSNSCLMNPMSPVEGSTPAINPKGMLARIQPNPIGTSKRGSKPFLMAR